LRTARLADHRRDPPLGRGDGCRHHQPVERAAQPPSGHPRSPLVTTTDGERLILASKSAARRAVLTEAGVPFTVHVADVDEDALKTPDVDPVELAAELARAKALAVSRHDAEAWV